MKKNVLAVIMAIVMTSAMVVACGSKEETVTQETEAAPVEDVDRKSTRLNSSHP